jgi:DNA-binding XRE family transcriptional regulator
MTLAARRNRSKPNISTLRQILAEEDEENDYHLFAPTHINASAVSRAAGAVVAAQRESVNLTPEAAAHRADINTARLRAIEKGAQQPNLSTFLALCEAIGVDPRELFSRLLDKMHYPVGYVPVRRSQPFLK